jgi:hypothetical protein
VIHSVDSYHTTKPLGSIASHTNEPRPSQLPAVGLTSLADLEADQGELAAAEARYRRTRELLTPLVASDPAVQDYRNRLGRAHLLSGMVQV